jgi:hypothetical protein
MQLKGPVVDHVVPQGVALDASTSNGRIVIAADPQAGQFAIAIPATAMAGLVAGVYVGDLLCFSQANTITCPLVIRLTVHQGETVPKSP